MTLHVYTDPQYLSIEFNTEQAPTAETSTIFPRRKNNNDIWNIDSETRDPASPALPDSDGCVRLSSLRGREEEIKQIW